MLPDATAAHYRAQQRLTLATIAAVRAQWRRMGNDYDASWARIGPNVLTLVTAAQLSAARSSVEYVPAVLDELGIDPTPVAEVSPRAFAGIASDGRPLDSLLTYATVVAKARGLDAGGKFLDRAVQTQVADARRVSAGVGITVRPKVTGYVRMLNPPSCGRCAILAGRHYRWSAGFRRHDFCDCTHIPANEDVAGDLTTDPTAYFKSLSAADQDKHFGAASARAIRDGADMNQVVNADRSMYTAGGRKFTREGVTKRGVAGKRLGTSTKGIRLTPEQVYADAVDREDALRLLKRFAYIL